jgi:hypothetical protein
MNENRRGERDGMRESEEDRTTERYKEGRKLKQD